VLFPVVLTLKYACDIAVITLLRGRTLGNSPTAFRNNLLEVHSEEWLRRQLCYLQDCQRHRITCTNFLQPVPTYLEACSFPPFPTERYPAVSQFYYSILLCRWFLAAYIREVWSRLPALLAASTSIYGSILKIDGTKKICRKLQGAAAKTASWATNVGNERGEVLISILTASEGVEALQPFATGLMRRYQLAGVDPPVLLYTDRDCCSQSGPSKYQVT
jgi:hypothetical protein